MSIQDKSGAIVRPTTLATSQPAFPPAAALLFLGIADRGPSGTGLQDDRRADQLAGIVCGAAGAAVQSSAPVPRAGWYSVIGRASTLPT